MFNPKIDSNDAAMLEYTSNVFFQKGENRVDSTASKHLVWQVFRWKSIHAMAEGADFIGASSLCSDSQLHCFNGYFFKNCGATAR